MVGLALTPAVLLLACSPTLAAPGPYGPPAELARIRLAQHETRLIAVVVDMAETGPEWVAPGVSCPSLTPGPVQMIRLPEDLDQRRIDMDYVAELNSYIALYGAQDRKSDCRPDWSQRVSQNVGRADPDTADSGQPSLSTIFRPAAQGQN